MAEQVMVVKVIGDDTSLQRMVARDQKAIAAFGTTTTSGLGKVDAAFTKTQRIAAGGFIGGAALTASVAAIRASTDAASDLQEQVSKSGQVFGESSKDVVAWSATTAKALGVSQTAALEATGTFGNLFTAIGVGGPEAAKTSQRLVQLASDLASFNNADPTQVLDALRSGLVGEVEPLRRFGVLLTEARVQQVALAQTGKDNVKTLTAQEKALARVSIIFDDTAKAQGDFARTSESLANQQRILAAQAADLQANLGQLLLPAITELTSALVDASEGAILLADGLRAIGDVEVPPIRIPFFFDFPGGGGGDLARGIFNIAKFTPFTPFFWANYAKLIADQFDKDAQAQRSFLADSFARSINKMTTDALDTASRDFEADFTIDVDAFRRGKGFGTGLKPKDLFGPLVKQIPLGLEEALLDAQRSGNQQRIRRVLEQSLDFMTEALEDPRLKRPGRIEIKKVIGSITGQIESIDNATDAAIKSAQADADRNKEEARRLAEKRRDALRELEQARQFRMLGLGPTGQRPPPTVANLQKQLQSLTARLIDADKLTPKIQGQLNRVGAVLKLGADEVKEDTRSAIVDIFDEIRSTFDREADKLGKGPLTKTTSLNANKILEGLGLGRDMEKELRARLSTINTAGKQLAGDLRPTGQFRPGPISQKLDVTLTMDGDVVARNTIRRSEKTGRRNPPAKRGGI